jgi:hypothetical protein
MRALASISLGLHSQVMLLGQGQARQPQAHLLGLVQADAHALDEMLHVETRLERRLASQPGLRALMAATAFTTVVRS